MVRVIRCHRRNMKINIINGSEVSRLSVAIHFSIIFMAEFLLILAMAKLYTMAIPMLN